ncbi:MAG: DUF4388 domain-containing protein [Polyangiaceae bacterium]|nr:DUF4388 domain-containing protein [Polyangiaceae bacterium]
MTTGEASSISGTLADVTLADVLQVLGVTEKSGALVVDHSEERASITFRGGRIVTAQLDPPRYHLASYFLDRGWIDFETLHDALRRQASSDHHELIGQILVELGALTPAKLAAGLEYQIRAVLSEVFGWSFGAFEFTDGAMPAAGEYDYEGIRVDDAELRLAVTSATRPSNASPGESSCGPSPAIGIPSGDASWLAKPRLALIATDDLLIRHGLELRLRSEGFALLTVPGLEGVGPLLLASDDPEPSLVVDLDLVARTRTQALQAFHRLRRLRRQWPNLQLVTFGRQVPESFYQFVLRSGITFHVPRTPTHAENDIRIVRDFIEVLAQKLFEGPNASTEEPLPRSSSRTPRHG